MTFADMMRRSITAFPIALRLAPLVILLAVIGEGVQHVVEFQLGLFESEAAFREGGGHVVRLGFGIFKALCVILASVVISVRLSRYWRPGINVPAAYKLYFVSPWAATASLLPLILGVAPLLWLHVRFHHLAFGSDAAPVWLSLDSVLVGALAVYLGINAALALVLLDAENGRSRAPHSSTS